MKPLQTVILAAFGALALGSSCHKCAEKEPSPCPTYDATIVPVAGLDASLPCYKEASASRQFKNHVVNTTADYNALFSCAPPAIDFTKYTLLIGKTVTNSGNSLTGQQVRQDCLNITYSVSIQQNPTTVVQPRVYYALVAKLPAGTQVTFDVQVKQ